MIVTQIHHFGGLFLGSIDHKACGLVSLIVRDMHTLYYHDSLGAFVFDTHISTVLSGGLFRKILANEALTPLEFNLLTGILINNNVPFDTAFAAGTRKNPPSLQLTIHINPSATLVLVTNLEPGSSVFSPSP